MNPIEHIIEVIGSGAEAARICDISGMAFSKWKKKGCLPRTEYTGKTHYAQKLAKASKGAFTAQWLLEKANPDKATA